MTTTARLPRPRVALISFEEVFESWMDQRTVSDSRHKADGARFRKYLSERFANVNVTDIRKSDVEKHLQSLLKQGVGPFTVDTVLAVMRGTLQFAVDQRLLQANVAWGLEIESAPATREIPATEVLDDEQTERLLAACQPAWRPLLALAARYGLSWSEAIGLQVQDINFKTNQIMVGRLIASEVTGKIVVKEGVLRTRYVDNEMIKQLAQHVMATADLRMKAKEPWLFITSAGTLPLKPNFNRFYLRPALEAAGIDPRSVTFHTLRHTAARNMLERGVPLQEVATALGHKSLTTTKRYYGSFVPKN